MFGRWFLLFLTLIISNGSLSAQEQVWKTTQGAEFLDGFFPIHYQPASGAIYLEIAEPGQDFLLVNALRTGLGSNDIGLDRGQLGDTRVVRFERHGGKVLLVQENLNYRAISDNPAERQAVQEAFASSVLWGFPILEEKNGTLLVDFSSFLLQDAHGVAERLKSTEQGTFQLDLSRSAIYRPGCKNFPQNTELEAIISFTGQAKGGYLRSVAPSASAISARLHYSMVALPDADYQPRPYDPRSGYFGISFADYAQPIEAPLQQRYLVRHRLEKKDPASPRSEAVEPIIYYVDPGTPEPIKSALIEGASWWNEAFSAAGFIDAFQVKELPPDADPLDVRYNVIQWVHRSTRGWSYGATVTDPRTGEIIKGHVSLGSLRVRQDFLIAQGLLAPYEAGETPDPAALALALARLRQLSAHEVGHTLGLAHNFAASYNDRASVMDYPHPLINLTQEGEIDPSEAYAVGIGDWDKRTIQYGYQVFPAEVDATAALKQLLLENERMGLLYLSDQDARPPGGAHPYAHLWDNGKNPAQELRRILKLRQAALAQFGENNLAPGRPMSELEAVLVPLFFAHRYQVEAAIKLIGGVQYDYSVNGEGPKPVQAVPASLQQEGLDAILATLTPTELLIPERIRQMIPPQPNGFRRHRELFPAPSNLLLDPVASAQSMVDFTLELLLHPDRLARLLEQENRQNQFGVSKLLEKLWQQADRPYQVPGVEQQIRFMVEKRVALHIALVATNRNAPSQARAEARFLLSEKIEAWEEQLEETEVLAAKAHYQYLIDQIEEALDDPEEWEGPKVEQMPPGSPIGCGAHLGH